MTRKVLGKLSPGAPLIHRLYGACTLREVLYSHGTSDLFGVIVKPVSKKGRMLLALDSGNRVPVLLEGSLRNLNIPKEVTP